MHVNCRTVCARRCPAQHAAAAVLCCNPAYCAIACINKLRSRNQEADRPDRRCSLHRRDPVRELAAHLLCLAWLGTYTASWAARPNRHGLVVYVLMASSIVSYAIAANINPFSGLLDLMCLHALPRLPTALTDGSYMFCAICSTHSSHFPAKRFQSPYFLTYPYARRVRARRYEDHNESIACHTRVSSPCRCQAAGSQVLQQTDEQRRLAQRPVLEAAMAPGPATARCCSRAAKRRRRWQRILWLGRAQAVQD